METKKVVNGLSCSFNKNTYLVWSAFICGIISIIMTIYAYTPFRYYVSYPEYLLGAKIFSIVQIGAIIAIIYYFQNSSKTLGKEIHSAARLFFAVTTTLAVLTTINYITMSDYIHINNLIFIIIGVWLITAYNLGKQIVKKYDGELTALGNRIINLVYIVITSICLIEISFNITLINIKISVIFTLTMIVIISLYTFFGVLLKMAKILDTEYDIEEKESPTE